MNAGVSHVPPARLDEYAILLRSHIRVLRHPRAIAGGRRTHGVREPVLCCGARRDRRSGGTVRLRQVESVDRVRPAQPACARHVRP